jgi:pimeloyl-ACP methyl ester carboxylesterase
MRAERDMGRLTLPVGGGAGGRPFVGHHGPVLTAWARALERRRTPSGRSFGPIHAVISEPLAGPARRTVVLVHGMYGSATSWSPVLLAGLTDAGYRVVAVDRPGHGFSARCPGTGDGEVCGPTPQATMLREALAEGGVRPDVVVGHSWGAAVALCWALDAPDGLAGIVSVAGYLVPTWSGIPPLYRSERTPTYVWPLAQVVAPFMARRTFEGPAPAHVRDALRVEMLPSRLAANFEDYRILGHELLPRIDEFPALAVPAEVLTGDRDRTLNAEAHSHGFCARVPRARLTVIPGAGHALPETHPSAVVAAVRRLAG